MVQLCNSAEIKVSAKLPLPFLLLWDGGGKKALKYFCLLLKYFYGYCIGFPQAVPDGL